MPVVIFTSRKLLRSITAQESEPVRILPESVSGPITSKGKQAPLFQPPEIRFLIDVETGKLRTVSVDRHTGIAHPLTAGVSKAVEAMLQKVASTAIREHPTVSYVYDEASQSIQTVFTDPKTGKVLHKLPEDDILAMNATMREWAVVPLVDAST
jgi:hypothetical protein